MGCGDRDGMQKSGILTRASVHFWANYTLRTHLSNLLDVFYKIEKENIPAGAQCMETTEQGEEILASRWLLCNQGTCCVFFGWHNGGDPVFAG